MYKNTMRVLKRSVPIVILGLVLLFFCHAWGCFTANKYKGGGDWQLSPGAEKIYNYLSLEQDSRSTDIEQVKKAVKGLCELDPSPETFVNGAAMLLYRGDKSAALDIAQQGLLLYPENSRLILLVAEIHILNRQNDKALSLLSVYVKNHPDDVDIALRLAELFLKSRAFDRANEILDLIPDSAMASADSEAGSVRVKSTSGYLYIKGQALSGMGKYKAAEGFLRQAIEKDPDFLEARAELAFLLEKENRLAEALAEYRRMLELEDDNASIWIKLVSINLRLDKVDDAFAAVQAAPRTESFLMQSGSLFLNAKLYSIAEKIFLQAAALPNAPDEAFLYLSLTAFENGMNVDKAIAYLDMIQPDSEIYERATLLKIQTYSDVERLDDATNVADKAIKEFPDKRSFWQSKAALLHMQDKNDQAELVINEALKHLPNDAELLFAKGAFYDQTGRKAEAMQVMEDIIKIYPDDPAALNYIGYTLAERNEDLPRAYELISKALQGDPENTHIIDSLAWVQFQQGNYQAAWDTIIRSIGYDPKEPTIWEHYGDIARVLNKNDEAKKAYQKALEFKPDNADEIMKKLNSL